MYFFTLPAKKIVRYFLPLTGTLLLSFLIFQFNNNRALAECGVGNCPCNGGGEYCCQGGEMCCTGAGCPSYGCNTGEIDGVVYKYNAKIKGGVWTCCTKAISPDTGQLIDHCTDSLLYKKIGTCEWCTGTSKETAPEPCVCPAAPTVPNLISPANGATFEDVLPITLDWSDSNWGGGCCGSRTYQLQVRLGSKTFNDPLIVDDSGLGETSSYSFTTPFSDEYCWRVRAHNDYNGGAGTWSGWSTPRCFVSEVHSPGGIFRFNESSEMTFDDGDIWNLESKPVDYILATATDLSAANVGLNLKNIHVYARKDPNMDGDFSDGSWSEVLNDMGAAPACNDSTPCNIPGSFEGLGNSMGWDPTEGFWQLHMNAISNDDDTVSARGRCTCNLDRIIP